MSLPFVKHQPGAVFALGPLPVQTDVITRGKAIGKCPSGREVFQYWKSHYGTYWLNVTPVFSKTGYRLSLSMWINLVLPFPFLLLLCQNRAS